jgi:hypothetical protein
MFYRIKGNSFRRTALMGLLALVTSASAMAADTFQSSSGLGQAWPNATDVSASPHWHVYVFQRDGIRYIQVNDLNGKVHAAVAASGGQFLVLPIGVDSQNVSTPDQPLSTTTDTTTSTSSEVVYDDSSVSVSVTPQASGVMTLQVACTDPIECSGSRAN